MCNKMIPTKQQQDKEKIPHKNKILKDAHYVKVEVVECATDQLSIVPEDLQLGEVEKIDDTMFPMIQNEIVLIPPIDTYDSRRVWRGGMQCFSFLCAP